MASTVAAAAVLHAQSVEPGGVLRNMVTARFAGSGSESIQAIATDADGYVYVAGTTSSPDLPMKNAAQQSMGESALMRSTDKGATWQRLVDIPSAALTITPHPVNQAILLVGTADGIYKTTDTGLTWRRVHFWSQFTVTPSSFSCCYDVAFDPADPRLVYTMSSSGAVQFLASTDTGETWQVRAFPFEAGAPLLKPHSLWVDPHGSGLIGVGLAQSADRGQTWNRINAPSTNWVTFVVSDPLHKGWLYAATAGGTTGQLFASKDSGATWVPIPIPLRLDFQPAVEALLFDPDQPELLYAITLFGQLHATKDAGATWRTLSPDTAGGLGSGVASLSRKFDGGGMFSRSARSLDFGVTSEPVTMTGGVQVTAGPGCALYAIRSRGADTFVAKLAPGGKEVRWSTFLGGSGGDVAVALAVDPRGNVYVGGNTNSPDFPVTSGRFGEPRGRGVFAVKYDAEGRLVYSTAFAGETLDGLNALAVGPAGEAHLVGWTLSKRFPATPGAVHAEAGPRGHGFAIKLTPSGAPAYVTYLPRIGDYPAMDLTINPPRAMAVLVEPGGAAVIGGFAGLLIRLSADGSTVTELPGQPGQIFAMDADVDGNIYVTGQYQGSGSGSCFQGFYQFNSTLLPGDIFLRKLTRGSLEPVFSTRLSGNCKSWPGVLRVARNGEITLGLWTYDRFPTLNSALPFSTCGLSGSAAVTRLSADGATPLYSSFIDLCSRAAPLAVGADGSIHAGVSDRAGHAELLGIPVPAVGPVSIEQVVDTLSGESGVAAAGRMLSITGHGFTEPSIDLGLNRATPLPAELGGVRVLFDGAPAGMFAVTPDRLICIVPASVSGKASVEVRVNAGALESPPFFLPVPPFPFLSFLTKLFPDSPAPGTSVDANVRNADGTPNGEHNPAARGSTMTLFAMGLVGPGPLALLWDAPPRARFESPGLPRIQAAAEALAGFVDGLYTVRFQIPGQPGELHRAVVGRVDSGLGVWVK